MAEEFAPLRAEGGQQRVAVVELLERPAVPRDEAGRFEVGILFAPILPARIQVEEVDDGELREFQEEVQEKRRHRAYPEHRDPFRQRAGRNRPQPEEFGEIVFPPLMSAAQLQVQPFLPVGIIPFRPVSGAPLLEHFRAVDLVLVEEVGDPAAELPALQFRLRSRQVGGELGVALRLPFENPADFPRQEFGREPLEVGPELRKDRFERPVDEVDQKRRVEIRGDPAGVPDAQLQPCRHALRLHHYRFGGENVGGQRAADERDELLRQPLELVARIKVKFHKNALAVTGGNIPERGLFFNPGRRIFAENPRRPAMPRASPRTAAPPPPGWSREAARW